MRRLLGNVQVSNDGGFSSWRASAVNDAERYPFTLPSSGQDRLPKTVYMRFEGATLAATRTFTDDIILDEQRPEVSTHASSTARVAASASR